MALTKCAKCRREWQADSGIEPCPFCASADHAAEVARLTGERDALAMEVKRHKGEADLLQNVFDGCKAKYASAEVERDAAVARAERAEEALRSIEEYWNRSETDGAMSDALHYIIVTVDSYFAAAQDAKHDHITVWDVDKELWETIKKAAEESNWIPKEYYMNDWVYDVCGWLRNHPEDAKPRTLEPEQGGPEGEDA